MGWGCRVLGSLRVLPELARSLSGMLKSPNSGSAQLSILNDPTALSFLFFLLSFLSFFSSQRPLREVHSISKNACLMYLSAAREQRSNVTMKYFMCCLDLL